MADNKLPIYVGEGRYKTFIGRATVKNGQIIFEVQDLIAYNFGANPCPTCTGQVRETVNLVCQTCGTDYGKN